MVKASDVVKLVSDYEENQAKREKISKLEKELGPYLDCPLTHGELDLAIRNMKAEIEELTALENTQILEETKKMSHSRRGGVE